MPPVRTSAPALRPFRPRLAAAAAALLVAVLAAALLAPARAATRDEGRFDVYYGILYIGHLGLAAEQHGARYSVRTVIESGGLAGLFRRARYDARSEGLWQRGRPVPLRYEEEADTGRRQSRAVIAYENGVPRLLEYDTSRDADRQGERLDPASQGGTLDPNTALWLALRDVEAGEVCRLDIEMFDGRRRSRMQFVEAVAAPDGRVVCRGEYRRLAGFALRDMGEKTRFPFEVTFAPLPDGRMRAVEAKVETLFGRAWLTRR